MSDIDRRAVINEGHAFGRAVAEDTFNKVRGSSKPNAVALVSRARHRLKLRVLELEAEGYPEELLVAFAEAFKAAMQQHLGLLVEFSDPEQTGTKQ